MDLVARRRDGSEFPAEISLSSIDTPDGVLVAAAVRDVTERIEARAERERLLAVAERERVEAQLHRAQRLESLGQLAGGVAHDFNNLLAVIINYAEFISAEVRVAVESDPHRWGTVVNDVDQIRRAAERAADLTRQLLAFGGREVVHPQPLDLNTVLAELEPLLVRTLGTHIDLRIEPATGLWRVMADAGQIEQVLVNLAINARDAMPGGGTLSIDTANIVADAEYVAARPPLAPGAYVRLRVSDSGTGMPLDVVQQAFEPFFTTKPKGEGTGLGLATVYGIISQTGGDCRIYSEPALGTTITALLPATEQQAQNSEPRAPVPASAATAGQTILVVEDEDAMREVTERILTRNGHAVLSAANGPAAISLARRHHGPIDLLLTDVVMPKMLGREVAERIRDLRPGIQVVFMSGYAHPVLTSQGTLAPGVVLIEKPFTESTLMARLREVLDSDE
jgi:signal transduction histidine kinase/CheY-like chemotaxis protein